MRVSMVLRTVAIAAFIPSIASAATPLFVNGSIVVAVSDNSLANPANNGPSNAASALTLLEFSKTGTQVGSINVSALASTPFSVEYGSSSEGFLQRSGDGKSLTIMGYGVDATTFNASPATYGSNDSSKPGALAQSTSIKNATTTAVARVVANIGGDGTIDTSTAIFGIYDQNNPRGAYTADGKSFYVSGQGVSGDSTGGIFLAQDGASSATPITGASGGGTAGQDTRFVTVYNDQLYTSVDSKQGATNRDFVGTVGTGLPGGTDNSGPQPLANFDIKGKLTLNATTGNSLFTAKQQINISPEQYFFADANTLYIADSGQPKNTSGDSKLGDGGLQKWTYSASSGKWTLAYTLSAGLSLVPNNSYDSTSTSGVTGLFGLASQLNGDGTVTFYATSSVIGDTDTTYFYSITDTLNAKTGAGESFTTLATAAAGTKFMGVAFAPDAGVSAVPEPASWGLMVLGFGAIGGMVRRRRVVFA